MTDRSDWAERDRLEAERVEGIIRAVRGAVGTSNPHDYALCLIDCMRRIDSDHYGAVLGGYEITIRKRTDGAGGDYGGALA